MEMGPRIVAFDLRSATGEPTGVGRHLLSIARAAAQLSDVRIRAYVSLGELEAPPSTEVVAMRARGIRWHLAVWRHLRSHPVTAYLSTSLVIPSLPGVRALPVVLDMSSFRVPGHQTRRTRLFEHALMGRAVSRHPLVFGSEAAAADTRELFPKARGIVVPPWFPKRPPGSVAAGDALAELHVEEPYVLMVGTVEPRKNVLLGAQTVARLRERGRDLRLVIVGRQGWAGGDEVSSLRELERRGAVVWPGYVTDAQRDELYAGASALLLPSIYEGFGMPLVEAMAAGVPCLCSAIPAFEEVAGDAALRLDPAQPDRWVEALDELLDNPKLSARMRSAGLARAATYTRERTAEAFARALSQLG